MTSVPEWNLLKDNMSIWNSLLPEIKDMKKPHEKCGFFIESVLELDSVENTVYGAPHCGDLDKWVMYVQGNETGIVVHLRPFLPTVCDG